jgi:hypothetical protein
MMRPNSEDDESEEDEIGSEEEVYEYRLVDDDYENQLVDDGT